MTDQFKGVEWLAKNNLIYLSTDKKLVRIKGQHDLSEKVTREAILHMIQTINHPLWTTDPRYLIDNLFLESTSHLSRVVDTSRAAARVCLSDYLSGQ